MKHDERTLEALGRLRDPSFKHLMDWLRAERAETLETLVAVTDPERKARLSGRCQQQQEFIDSVDKVSELMTKLKQVKRP